MSPPYSCMCYPYLNDSAYFSRGARAYYLRTTLVTSTYAGWTHFLTRSCLYVLVYLCALIPYFLLNPFKNVGFCDEQILICIRINVIEGHATHMGSISPTCLSEAFMLADPKISKRQSIYQSFFLYWDLCAKKAVHKTYVKSTHGRAGASNSN